MKEVKDYLKKVIENNSSVVVACSGGPDSMCLLHLLLSFKKSKNLNIICAHVNHKMRIESEEEAEFVKDYCLKYGAKFEYMEITNYSDDNFHNQAREKRYDFFKKLIKTYNAKYLMTAHHGDDLIETILMRIVRGSNLKGYLGFKRESYNKTYTVIRPLITLTKNDIEKYNVDNNIPFVCDLSNASDKYTRNRYRHHILPVLKNEDKEVHKKFYKFSKELIELDEFLVNYMSNTLTTVLKDDTLNVSLFNNLDSFIKRKIIEKMIYNIQEDDLFVIENKHVDLILDLISNNKPNCYLELPNNFIAVKSYNEFKITKQNTIKTYCIKLEDYTKLNNGYVISKVIQSDDTSNYTIRLNSKELSLPLYIRTRRDGDKIEVKNLNGSKKVKDVFIDCKIPKPLRDTYPILTDSDETVIWLPGLKKSKFDKEKSDIYDIILKYEEENNE